MFYVVAERLQLRMNCLLEWVDWTTADHSAEKQMLSNMDKLHDHKLRNYLTRKAAAILSYQKSRLLQLENCRIYWSNLATISH